MTDERIYIIGTVQLYESEIRQIWDRYTAKQQHLFIVTYRRIYQVFYSVNAGFYGQEVYRITSGNFAKRGRFHCLNGKEVNDLIGFKHFYI